LGDGACAGLYCHGNSGADSFGTGAVNQSTWGGTTTATPPKWDNTVAASCGSCHNASTGMAQGNHPAHLVAAYGPPSSQFTATGTCSDGIGCHTSYGLSLSTTHANGQPTFRTSPSINAGVGLGLTQICVNCHTTYASANVPSPGDTLVRTRANWDNTTYKVACATCHNGGVGTQGWQNLDGSGHRAPAIENTYYGNGHGAASIDNAGTTTDAGLVDQVPPVRCETCHDELSQHIGTAKDGVNPWRLDNAVVQFAQAGALDAFCLGQCHTAVATSPARHAWRVNGSAVAPAQSKDNTVHTHPTSMQVVPQAGAPPAETVDKSRWFQVPSDTNLPFLGDLSTKTPPARTNGSQFACVTCHDPHGVGAAVTATRTFSGANSNGFQMLRYNANDNATALCAKCHR
jgi:hypothetical protein